MYKIKNKIVLLLIQILIKVKESKFYFLKHFQFTNYHLNKIRLLYKVENCHFISKFYVKTVKHF